MKVGLLLNSNNKLCPYSEKYREILNGKGIPYILIDPNSALLHEELKSCSHLLFRHSQGDTDIKIYDAIFFIAYRIYKIKCYPNYETFWQYEDKVKEFLLLKSLGFPIINSNIFWNYNHAFNFLQNAQLPVVVKLPKGASSDNVIKINTISEGKKIIDQVFFNGVKSKGLKNRANLSSLHKKGAVKYWKNLLKSTFSEMGIIKDKTDYPEWQIQKDSILFQTYLPNNTFDTRVTIIGKKAFAFRRFVRKNDFRASGSGNLDLNPEKIDIRCVEIAFKISQKLNFDTMAYDFIYDQDNTPNINEISYCFVDKYVHDCPGYWDDALNWHKGNFWPQQMQLEDFLEIK